MSMKLKVIFIHNQGDAAEEYALLRINVDCDIGKYLLADSTFMESGRVSNKLRHLFWFPDKVVQKGELVSVRTGEGKNTELTNRSGIKVHRFFWGLNTAVWNDVADCAVLFEASAWDFYRVSNGTQN